MTSSASQALWDPDGLDRRKGHLLTAPSAHRPTTAAARGPLARQRLSNPGQHLFFSRSPLKELISVWTFIGLVQEKT